jgi:hypothetical protein
MLPADYIFGSALVFVVACNFHFSSRIEQERIAMQWGSGGEPTWYAPKWLAMWGMVLFMVAVRLFIWLASTYAPQSVHGVDVGIAGFSVIVAASHLFILMKARTALRS